MTTTRKAMESALEALNKASTLDHSFSGQKQHYEAIESLKAALAAQGEKRESERRERLTDACGKVFGWQEQGEKREAVAAILPNGKIASNVYEAYEIGREEALTGTDPVAKLSLSTSGMEVVSDYGVMRYGQEFDVFTHPDPRIKELEAEVERWKTKYANAMDVNTNVRAERDAAKADRDALHREWEKQFGERSFGEVVDQIETLRYEVDAIPAIKAERDAAMVDARRYRWLRDNCVKLNPASTDGPAFKRLEFTGKMQSDWRFAIDHFGLDAAIDSAMMSTQNLSNPPYAAY